ncbi:MAG: sialidase family protein, partial [Nitrospirota bacterium]
GGGFPHNNINHIYRSTDGGNTWTHTYTGPSFAGPGVTASGYFACMFSPAYWRHEGWGQPAAFNNVVHLVYAQHGAGADAGDVYYIRSTNSGVTFSAPFKLNSDATTRPQWQPNISVSPSGTLLATWYDGREFANCVKGDENTPCYRMWSRKSTDNGATWLADDALSDVASPLPGQPDGTAQSTYAGDYDYGSAIATKHLTSWDDGRVTINSQSQQDVFFDQEAVSTGGVIVLQAKGKPRNGKTQVTLSWSPADGGNINVLRDGVIVQTTPDDGATKDNLGTQTGTFTYQVCETDSGDCSNEVDVIVP